MADKFDRAYKFNHVGIITDKPKEGGRYFPEFKLWTSNYEKSEFRIEWICFDDDCELHPLIQAVSHVAFQVEDIQKAIKGRKVSYSQLAL